MKRALSLGIASLVLSIGAARADEAPPPPYATNLAQLDERLSADCAAGRFAGVVAPRKAGKVIYQHACGLADVTSQKPNTLSTRYKIFSVSKSFTETLVMMLADRHLIGLDEPARRYVPELPAEWSGLTIRQLLDHTSGIPDLTEKLLQAYQANPSAGYDGAMHTVLSGASAEDKAISGVPGSKFLYNNFGYEILARVIENVSHAPYEQVITKEIFNPAHMDTAEIARPAIKDGKLTGSQPSLNLAQGYNGNPGALESANSFQFVQIGAGAIYASAQDMFNFDSALSSGTLVSKNIVADCRAHAFVLFPEPNGVSYGCGWMNREIGEEPYFQHDGGTNGFNTDFARDPREGVAVVVMSNLGFTYPIASSIRHALMAILLTPQSRLHG
ncbi:serine hydrolase domain-containing protein [Chelatococcus sp. GCM10030263]|uniref:serine hydrolase domain-containing protein n=1 Tax=Chelatococcus sp. GCM10030263 TaxID=3273387 RepID=UPI003611BD19